MKGELEPTEFHPVASDALKYITSLPMSELMTWLEACASCAIEGSRPAEICAETLQRILKGQPVGDRYVLGLAWMMREDHKLQERLHDILHRTANALKGEPPEDTWHSWHDLPEVAAALKAEVEALKGKDGKEAPQP